jgi:Mg-chelatase subunit ChlD
MGRVRSLVVLATLATACSVQQSDSSDPNNAVEKVVVVGTSVTSALYVSGDLGLTTIPEDGSEKAILAKELKFSVSITSPIAIPVEVNANDCTAPDANKSATTIGIIIDDSGSMAETDPNHKRKDATIDFLNSLGTDDQVLLTDYGTTGDNLRDLLCASSGTNNASCSPPKATFSKDRAALIKAVGLIEDAGGTPLYGSCAQMVPLIDSVKDQRRGMLLLSDGEPSDMEKRDACHAAAKAAQIPVFTVGLGPAAEGDPNASPDAVKVLRELASDTTASYASANDPAQLQQLFRNMGSALSRGACRTTARVTDTSQILPGTKVTGEVSIGSKGAKSTFEFVAPQK